MLYFRGLENVLTASSNHPIGLDYAPQHCCNHTNSHIKFMQWKRKNTCAQKMLISHRCRHESDLPNTIPMTRPITPTAIGMLA